MAAIAVRSKKNTVGHLIRSNTPSRVGPGTYDLRETIEYTPSFVGFSSSQERATSGVSKSSREIPGPGSYELTSRPNSRAQPSIPPFRSTSSRFTPRYPLSTEFVPSSVKDNPGPGAYNIAGNLSKPTSRRGQQKIEPLRIEQTPSVPSVPQKEQSYGFRKGEDGKLIRQGPVDADRRYTGIGLDTVGPAVYDPKIEVLRDKLTRKIDFSRNKYERKLFEKRNEIDNKYPDAENPGIGAYNVDRRLGITRPKDIETLKRQKSSRQRINKNNNYNELTERSYYEDTSRSTTSRTTATARTTSEERERNQRREMLRERHLHAGVRRGRPTGERERKRLSQRVRPSAFFRSETKHAESYLQKGMKDFLPGPGTNEDKYGTIEATAMKALKMNGKTQFGSRSGERNGWQRSLSAPFSNPTNLINPGPGTYEIGKATNAFEVKGGGGGVLKQRKTLVSDSVGFSSSEVRPCLSHLVDHASLTTFNVSPGPGHYVAPSTIGKGRGSQGRGQYTSRRDRFQGGLFEPERPGHHTPGPAAYQNVFDNRCIGAKQRGSLRRKANSVFESGTNRFGLRDRNNPNVCLVGEDGKKQSIQKDTKDEKKEDKVSVVGDGAKDETLNVKPNRYKRRQTRKVQPFHSSATRFTSKTFAGVPLGTTPAAFLGHKPFDSKEYGKSKPSPFGVTSLRFQEAKKKEDTRSYNVRGSFLKKTFNVTMGGTTKKISLKPKQ
eukprot:g857.t1